MAENYTIPENPVYNENIRKIQNGDYVDAENVLNPVLQQIIGNQAAHQKNKADLVNGKVPADQIPNLNYVPTSAKGAANGVASLGSDKKIPVAQIPSLPYVPTTRKVNGKALNADISLSPNDVGVTAKRTCDIVIGTSTSGWTAADCDYLCDGVNDQIEINQALAAIPAFNGVRKIVFLQGWYNISGSISPLASVMLVGEANCADQYGSKPQLNFSNGSKLIISNSGAVGIKHLGIGQGDADSIISASQDTSDNGSPNCEFVDCYGNFHGKFPDGRFINCHGKLNISYSDSAIIRSCYFTYLAVSNCNNISIIGCGGFDSDTRPNIWLENISHAVIIGNLARNIDLRYSSENVVVGNHIIVSDNSYSSFGYYGIHMLEANRNEISGNSVLLDTGASASTHDTICLDSSSNNLVTDNLILGKNYSVTGGSGNTFVNNKYN